MNKYTITIDSCRDCADCMFARKPMSMGEDDPLYGYFCRAKGFKESDLLLG